MTKRSTACAVVLGGGLLAAGIAAAPTSEARRGAVDASTPSAARARYEQALRGVRRATESARLEAREAALAAIGRLDAAAKKLDDSRPSGEDSGPSGQDSTADREAAALYERLYRVSGDPTDLARARARLARIPDCEAALARAGLLAETGEDLRAAFRELSSIANRHAQEPCGGRAARSASILVAFAPVPWAPTPLRSVSPVGPGSAPLRRHGNPTGAQGAVPPEAVFSSDPADTAVAPGEDAPSAPPAASDSAVASLAGFSGAGRTAHAASAARGQAASSTPTVSRIAMWPEGVATRVAIYVDRACPFVKLEDPRGLRVRLPGAALGHGVPAERPSGLGIVRSIRTRRSDDGVDVILDVTGAVRYRVFPMGSPYRLIVDVARPEVGKALATRPPVRRIVIDAGHGGHDPGARGPLTAIEEKAVTLDIATLVARLLTERLGVEVVLTRKDDSFVALEERTAIANGAGADLFVSIHVNAAQDPHQSGVETFVLARSSERDALKVAARENRTDVGEVTALGTILATLGLESHQRPSEALAGLVQERLVRRLAARFGEVQDRGMRRAMFYVLVGAHMPAILVETSFLSNPVEEARLATEAYRRELAEGIYEGVAAYVRQPEEAIWGSTGSAPE